MTTLRTIAHLAVGIAIVAAPLISVHATAAQDDNPPTVKIDSGTVEGTINDAGVAAFLGIPYAAPPVRDLRWRAPQPVTPWKNIYHADRFGPQCMQPQRNTQANHYSGAEVTSEDCLYINIWAKPGLKDAPVIVYIHGGAFFIGSGSAPLYSGEALAERGVVFVNFNYRLGALGLMAHPELSKESPHHTSGDYGFLDQIAALHWVKDNIAKFGGNPDNVTIMGQSAGSMSVLAMQASPLAKGLFQRAVGMSGAIIGDTGIGRLIPLKQAEQNGLRLEKMWGAHSIAQMRALPADRLGVPRSPSSPPMGPVQDGYVLPDSVQNIFEKSAQSDVPLLLGFTHDESFGGLGKIDSLAQYKERVREKFGDRADQFLKLYPANNDAEAKVQARLADRDASMVTSMEAWANAQATHGKAPVYSYMFAHPHSYAPNVTFSDLDPATAGAYHTSGVPFWLGTLDSFNKYRKTRDWKPEDRKLSSEMMDALVAFARTGSPDTKTLTFPRFDPKKERLLKLDTPPTLGSWPDRKKLEFFRHKPEKPAS